MFEKQSRNELKAFGLLIGFMVISCTLGTLFFSKIVLLLSSTFLGGLFLFLLFLSLIGGIVYSVYKLLSKLVPALSSKHLTDSTPVKKVFSFLKKKWTLYSKETRTNGFIASSQLKRNKK